MNTDQEIFEKARKKVKEKKEFYSHLTTYCLIIFGLFLLNMMTSPAFWQFIFPALGWGMGIVGHYVNLFGFPGKTSAWEERQLEKEIQQLERERSFFYHPNNEQHFEEGLELRELRKLNNAPDEDEFV